MMDSVYMAFLVLAGLPLLAFVISVLWGMMARRNRDLARDEWAAERTDTGAENARMIIVLAYGGTKVIYGVVQAFYLAMQSGCFSGMPEALELGLSLPAFCALFGAVNALTTLAGGGVAAGAVRREALTDMEGFRRTIIKLCLVEFAAICGLLASFLLILF